MIGNFVVVDSGGSISYSADAEEPETFDEYTAALARAKELADSTPGETVGVYKLAAEIECKVSAPEVTEVP